MILHQIEALAAAGVTDVVLAVNYRPEIMEKHLGEVSWLFCSLSLVFSSDLRHRATEDRESATNAPVHLLLDRREI
jgi:NDP-sugar pyrophosphorylase family protein